jgi:LysR family hydrogen peroxide-inducible transcriptional activator
MNFQQLKYVLAVHNHKHFGLAAESCHITQATLSAMIKKIEQELDLTLFDRSRHPIKTTEEGETFIQIAKKIIIQEKELRSINDKDDSLSGTLRIGIIPTIANSLLPIILPKLISENPNLKLKISEITTENILHQLSMDKIDIGILATPLEKEDYEETILYYEPMMVYGISDQGKGYVSSEDVKDKNVWLLEEGHCFRNQAVTICEIQEKQMNQSNLDFEGSSFETLLNLTDTFGGYTLIPELYYKDMPENKKRKTKHFQRPIPVREVSLVTYYPAVKGHSVKYLKSLIIETVANELSTKNYKNSELDIIGI